MEAQITDKNYDLIFKDASNVFKDKMLEFLGIDAPEIKRIITIDLPSIEANIKQTDFVFELADASLLHLEFQTGYKKEDTYRFLTYDARLHKEYNQNIRTVVVYIKDTTGTPHRLEAGSIIYNTETVLMNNYNGDQIYAEEKAKAASGKKPDKLRLTMLPLMKSAKPAAALTKDAIQLAKQSSMSENEIIELISAIIVLANKILTKEDINEIWEEISMLKAIQFAEERGLEKGKAEVIYKQLLFKFKNVPAEYEKKLKELPSTKLEIIGFKILEAQTLAELEEYLL